MNLESITNILKNASNITIDQVLIDLKDFIHIKDECGETLLIWASRWNQESLALKLVDKGVDINAKDTNINTALIWASFNKLESLAAKLIEKGADIDVRNNLGKSAVGYIRERWPEDAKKKILDLIESKNKYPTLNNIFIPSVVQSEVKSNKYPFNVELAVCLSKNKIPYKVVDEFIIL